MTANGAAQAAHAYVALRPGPGRPRPGRLTVENVRDFHAHQDAVEEVARHLAGEGFSITGKSRLGVAVAGEPELAGRMFASFLLSGQHRPPTPVVPPHLEPLVDHVRVAPRVRWFGPPRRSTYGAATATRRAAAGRAPSPDAPPLPYYHLDVPDDVARLMNAHAAHDFGFTGAGVRLCVIDTGFHPHAWYAKHGFSVSLVGENHPEDDEVGHGTGITTNALAVAPGASVIGVKLDVDAAAAFQRARTADPRVISCSWGTYGFDRDLHDEIVDAVAHGIVVLFAAGNGPGGASWPGSMPEVVSVGGVYVDERGRLEASSYASSGTNSDEPGRRCPDVCGLTGQMPMGIYIAMPTQEGCELDREFAASGAPFPDGDGTGPSDGWLVASGTSSATPAVAGVAALVLEADPDLDPVAVKERLRLACRDVTVGASANGDRAGEGPDPATGAGLADALLAVHPVDLWCKDCPDDNGTVPNTYAARWTSPDIWIRRKPDGGLDAGYAPRAGKPNWVYVRVRNRGREAAKNVRVRLFWTEPSLAVQWPTGWRADGIRVAGEPGNLLTLPDVPAVGETVAGPFEWLAPRPATLGLGARDGAAPGLAVRVECPDDTVLHEGDPPQDNNLAARNVLAAEVPPGAEAWFTLGLARPRGRKGTANLVVDRSDVPAKVTVALEPATGLAPGPEPAAAAASARKAPPPALRKIGVVKAKVLSEPLALVRGADQRVRVRIKVPEGFEPGQFNLRLDETVAGAVVGHATLRVMVKEGA